MSIVGEASSNHRRPSVGEKTIRVIVIQTLNALTDKHTATLSSELVNPRKYNELTKLQNMLLPTDMQEKENQPP